MIEIDGIQRALERPITEAGDYISDDYFKLLDLTTSPNQRSHANAPRIASVVRRLNRNLAATSVYLDDPVLAQAYNSVTSQVNELNVGIDGVNLLKPIITDSSKLQNYSNFYQRATY